MRTSWRRLSTAQTSWSGASVDITFVTIVGAALAWLLWATREDYFWVDDWRLLHQGSSLGGLFDGYNGHLSLVILSLYRGLAEVFGFEHWAFQVVGVLAFIAVPVSYYLVARRRSGATVAAVLALSFFAAERIWITPSESNHYLALVGGIICAGALNRGRRADLSLGTALSLSLASAGGGVAVATACIVHNTCTRAPRRRWVVVLVPSLAWLTWWALVGADYRSGLEPSLGVATRMVRHLAIATFGAFGLGSQLIGAVLMIAFLVYGASLIRRSADRAASWLAWTTALFVWWAGLAYSRGYLAAPHAFRYQLLGLGFVLLALIPRAPVQQRIGRSSELGHRRTSTSIAVVVAAGALWVPGVAHNLTDGSPERHQAMQINRGLVVTLGLGRNVVPDGVRLAGNMGGLTSDEVRGVLERYGYRPPAAPDRAIVSFGLVTAWARRESVPPSCRPLTDSVLQPPTSRGHPFMLWSNDTSVLIEVRRFDDEWVRVRDMRPGEHVGLTLPELQSPVPWNVRALGACTVPP